jgi:carbamoyl-phosphate synthase large subunit
VNTTEVARPRGIQAVRRGGPRVTYFTTLAAGLATCEALDHLGDVDVNRLQDLHKEVGA